MKKRILSIVLICSMLLLLIPTTVFAGNDETPPAFNGNWIMNSQSIIKIACLLESDNHAEINGVSLAYGTDYVVSDTYLDSDGFYWDGTYYREAWCYELSLTDTFLNTYKADGYWSGHQFNKSTPIKIWVVGNIALKEQAGYIYFTCDFENPVVSGLEADKTYCESVTFSVTDTAVSSVSYKTGDSSAVILTPDSDGNYTIKADGADLKNLTVTAEDTSGNKTEVKNITVNTACTPEADDGDCTTDVKCKYCGRTLVAAKNEHDWSAWTSDGNKTTHSRHCMTPGCDVHEKEACSHTWVTEAGQYWKKCVVCGQEGDKRELSALPQMPIQGADKVCNGHDYTFTFTLPEGVSNPTAGYDSGVSANELPVTDLGNGVYMVTVKGEYYEYAYEAGFTNILVIAGADTEDGYWITATKTIDIMGEHTGGTPTCTDKAQCEVCGDEYGEPLGHSLTHVAAKAPTTEAEGNTEYWYCEQCGTYFSDKDGKHEISLADTIVAKLQKTETVTQTTPKTGDESDMMLWLAMLLTSGVFFTLTGALGRRKHSVK